MLEAKNPIAEATDEVIEEPKEEVKTPAFAPEPGAVYEINMKQFKQLMKGPYYLIDARTAEAYAKGHIADAVNFFGGGG